MVVEITGDSDRVQRQSGRHEVHLRLRKILRDHLSVDRGGGEEYVANRGQNRVVQSHLVAVLVNENNLREIG